MPAQYVPTDEQLTDLNDVVTRLGRAFLSYGARDNGDAHSCGQVSNAHIMMLRHVREAGGMRQTDIARLLSIKAPAVSELIDHLIEVGIVTRQQDPNDRRAVTITLTPRGAKMLYKYEEKHTEETRNFVAGFSQEEYEIFCRCCEKMLGNVQVGTT